MAITIEEQKRLDSIDELIRLRRGEGELAPAGIDLRLSAIDEELASRGEPIEVIPPSPEEQFTVDEEIMSVAMNPATAFADPNDIGEFHSELKADEDIIQKDVGIERQGFVGTFKEIKEFGQLAKRIPIAGPIYKTARTLELAKMVQLINSGQVGTVSFRAAPAGGSTLITGKRSATEREKKKAMEFVVKWMDDLEKAQNRTTGGKFANALLEMPAFITEFLITGPIFKTGSVAAKATATRLLGKMGETIGGKVAIRAAGAGFGSLLRTGVNVPRVLAGAAENMTKGIATTDDGAVVFADADRNPWTALTKSFTDLYIENLSEIAGGAIGEVAGKAVKFTGKLAKKFPFVNKFTENIAEQWIKNAPPGTERTLQQFFTKATTKVGFNGILGEFSEERLGDVMRAATGLQEWDDVLVSKEEALIEAGIFTVFGGVNLASEKIFRKDAPTAKPVTNVKEISDKQIQDIAKKVPAEVKSAVKGVTLQEAIKQLKDATPDSDIKLGLERDVLIDESLQDLSEDQFEDQFAEIENKVIDIEKKSDDVELTREEKLELAGLQDKLTALDNEKFRRKVRDGVGIDIAKDFMDLNLKTKFGKVEGVILFDEVNKNPELKQEFKDALKSRASRSPDHAEVVEGKLKEARELSAEFRKAQKGAEDVQKPVLQAGKAEIAGAEAAKIVNVATKAAAIKGNAFTAKVAEIAHDSKLAIVRNIARAEDAVGTWGKTGLKVQKDLREIAFRTAVNVGNTTQNIKIWTKGLSKAEKVTVAKLIDGAIPEKGQPRRLVERAKLIKRELDLMQNEARSIGLRRTELTGRAFPQVLTKEGKAFLEEAERDGPKSAKVFAWAQIQVQDGKFKNVDEAIIALQRYREGLISGKTGYIEGTRTLEIGNEFRDWNLDQIISNTVESSWEKIEAARQWGVLKETKTDAGQILLPFKDIQIDIAKIRVDVGNNEANALNEYLKAQYGLSGADTAIVKVARVARTTQFVGKLAFSPLTITRNILDRYAKGLSHGTFFTNARATIKYPPFLNHWIKSARNIEDQMIRSGAVLGHGHLSEGFTGTEGALSFVARPFGSSERGNQTYIALVKKLQLESDVKRLMEIDGPMGVTSKMFDRLATLVGKSQNQTRNRVLTDMSNEQLTETFAQGKISDDVMSEVLHRTTTDSAFPLTLASKRLWWNRRPVVQAATQFKIWSADQTRFIYKDVLKYSVQTGDYSRLARFMVATWMVGELYNISRDELTGKDESVLSKIKGGTRDEIMMAIGKDLVDGGVVGMIADFTYGIGDWAAGPTVNSISGVATAIDQARGTATLPEALGQFLLQDAPALRQAQGLLDRIDRDFFDDPFNLTEDYSRWQGRSFDFRRKNGEKAGDIIGNRFMRSIRGVPQKKVTERSLSLNLIARQVLVGDYGDAAQHIKRVINQTEIQDLDGTMKSFDQSMRNNSPFGNISEEKIGLFITQFSKDEAVKGLKLQEKWIKGYQTSLKKAFDELKAEGFEEDIKAKAEAYEKKMTPIFEEAAKKLEEIMAELK